MHKSCGAVADHMFKVEGRFTEEATDRVLDALLSVRMHPQCPSSFCCIPDPVDIVAAQNTPSALHRDQAHVVSADLGPEVANCLKSLREHSVISSVSLPPEKQPITNVRRWWQI